MRNSIRLAAAALAATSFGSAAQAATTSSAEARAEVLSTLIVTPVADLEFGQIAVNGDGDVVVNADGTTSCAAAIVCTGTRNPASFDVTGTADVGIVATVTDASINLVNLSDATKSFVLDGFNVAYPNGTTLVAGATDFAVGGTLHVLAADAAAGVYEGTFNVSVEYQ